MAALADAGPRSPHPERSPYAQAWSHRGATFAVNRDAALELPVTGAPRLNPAAQIVLTMPVALTPERRGSCTALRLRYKPGTDKDYDPQRTVRVPVRADGRMREVTVGAFTGLRIDQEGTLRVEFECTSAATAEIGTMRLLEPLRSTYYRGRYLERLKRD